MPKLYTKFAEIEKEVIEKAPPIVYKYRDWSNPYHQSILTENTFWLSHPKDLNDPYDIRVPVRFDYSEIEHPLFFEKLKTHAPIRHPFIHPESREFKVICENQMDIIRSNPANHFEGNYLEIRESNLYDPVGVLSLTFDALNETMWAHYGSNSKGFCVGFDTVALAKGIECGFGFVTYQDEPPVHSFIKDIEENQKDQMFLKHSKWIYEKEFRFLTLRIQSDKDRAIKTDPSTVREIVLGQNTSDTHRDEIIKILKEKYEGSVKLFQVKANVGSYGLQKQEIFY